MDNGKPFLVDKNSITRYSPGDKFSGGGVVISHDGGDKYTVCKEAGAPNYYPCLDCNNFTTCEAYRLFIGGRL